MSDEPSFTIYFRGGPWHGRTHTGTLGCDISPEIGERFTVADSNRQETISTVYEYEFAYVRGPMVVARYRRDIHLDP